MAKAVGWGLIGASNIARLRVAGAISNSDTGHIAAVMSHNPALAASFAREFNIPKHYASLSDMLADPDIQAVYISSTNEHHHSQVMAAAAAGKHVLCEKPLAITLKQGREMVAACRTANVIMGVNHHLRQAVAIRAMRQAVMDGAIGAPVSALVSQPVFVPHDEWRRKQPGLGAGVSYDVLVHSADTLRFILDQEPVEVCALANSSPAMAENVFDTMMATYRFETGRFETGRFETGRFETGTLAQIYADFNIANGCSRIEVHGTEGTLVGEEVLGKNPAFRGRVTLTKQGDRQIIAEETDDSRYLAQINQFNAAIAGHGAPACTGLDGLVSLAMILGAEESATSKQAVKMTRER